VLENVRDFDELALDFGRPDQRYAGWTVVTGDHASGKETRRKALAAALVKTALRVKPRRPRTGPRRTLDVTR
jgi:hypothetical protein